jgi:hypothetical protein
MAFTASSLVAYCPIAIRVIVLQMKRRGISLFGWFRQIVRDILGVLMGTTSITLSPEVGV